MKVSIIGAGNGGLTAAYWIARNNHQVLLADDQQFATQLKAISDQKYQINAMPEYYGSKMLAQGKITIEEVTTDFAKAAKYAQIIIIICPSFAQEILFKKLLPFLTNEHIIVHMPGNYAALALNKIKNELGYQDLALTFVDAISIPFATRIINPGEIAILGAKTHLPISVWPKQQQKVISKQLESLFKMPFPLLANPLVAGLENINFGGHPLMTVCNMGLLENFVGKFNYYKDCCSPATANACALMDQERLKVGQAYDFTLRTELEAMNSLYGDNKKTVYDFNRASATHEKLHSAPKSSHDRYITEDIPYLLVPCLALAEKAGFDLPLVRSIITIANAYNKEDYLMTGRNLVKLGLNNLSVNEIKKLF